MTEVAQRPQGRSPSHPGDLVARFLVRNRGVTQEELARRLGVSRVTLSRLLNKRQAISAEMALRLERFTGIGAIVFMKAQVLYDLHQTGIEKAQELEVIQLGEEFRDFKVENSVQ